MIYEFHCDACDDNYELFFSHKEYHIPPCPVCQGEMKRVFTAPAIHEPKKRLPPGVVELGNEYQEPTKVDHMAGVEQEILEHVNNSDMELSKLDA